jgi:hypothetical protein
MRNCVIGFTGRFFMRITGSKIFLAINYMLNRRNKMPLQVEFLENKSGNWFRQLPLLLKPVNHI